MDRLKKRQVETIEEFLRQETIPGLVKNEPFEEMALRLWEMLDEVETDEMNRYYEGLESIPTPF